MHKIYVCINILRSVVDILFTLAKPFRLKNLENKMYPKFRDDGKNKQINNKIIQMFTRNKNVPGLFLIN